jgi:hypothetical protein
MTWTAEGVAFEAPAAPPDEVIAAIDRHEPEINALYRPDGSGRSGIEWRALYARRLRERPDAAFENVTIEWLNRHHPGTSPGHCAHCAKAGGVLLPVGVGPHAWIHDNCLDRWRAARRAQAIAALASYGIRAGPDGCQRLARRGGACFRQGRGP